MGVAGVGGGGVRWGVVMGRVVRWEGGEGGRRGDGLRGKKRGKGLGIGLDGEESDRFGPGSSFGFGAWMSWTWKRGVGDVRCESGRAAFYWIFTEMSNRWRCFPW